MKRLTKVKTVNDLLARDDINGIINDLNDIKPDIEHLVVIYSDKNGERSWIMTEDTMASMATWLLETTKMDLLIQANDDE